MRYRGSADERWLLRIPWLGVGDHIVSYILDNLFIISYGILNMRLYEIYEVCVLYKGSFMMYLYVTLVDV